MDEIMKHYDPIKNEFHISFADLRLALIVPLLPSKYLVIDMVSNKDVHGLFDTSDL